MKRDGFITKLTIFIILVSVAFGVLMSYTAAVEIEKSEGGDFCGKCHTMDPMWEAHRASVHGGNNKYGIGAKCVDCHLPHDSIADYIITKAKIGLNDTFVEFTSNTSEINWTKKRQNAKHFVYDSGCKSCHNTLDHSLMEKIEPSVVKKLEQPDPKISCIECHDDVGHKWTKPLKAELDRM